MVRSHWHLCDLKTESQTAAGDMPGFIKGEGCVTEKRLGASYTSREWASCDEKRGYRAGVGAARKSRTGKHSTHYVRK